MTLDVIRKTEVVLLRLRQGEVRLGYIKGKRVVRVQPHRNQIINKRIQLCPMRFKSDSHMTKIKIFILVFKSFVNWAFFLTMDESECGHFPARSKEMTLAE